MMKRGPLSTNEKGYIIKNLHNGVNSICKKLNRTEKCVIDFLNDVGMMYTMESEEKTKVEEEKKQIEASQPPQPTIMGSMGVHKPGTGVVVMTEGAASLSDARRQPRSQLPEKFKMSNHKNGKFDK